MLLNEPTVEGPFICCFISFMTVLLSESWRIVKSKLVL